MAKEEESEVKENHERDATQPTIPRIIEKKTMLYIQPAVHPYFDLFLLPLLQLTVQRTPHPPHTHTPNLCI